MKRLASDRPADGWPHIVMLDPFIPGLALARSMRRRGASVTVIEDKRFVARSRGVDAIVAPYRAGDDLWLQLLSEIAEAHEDVVVVTGSDRGSELLARARALPDNVRAFEHDGRGHLALMNKLEACRIASEAGVPTPWSGEVTREDQLEAVLADARWPCVVKPELSHQWREQYGEERVFLVENPDAASRLIRPPLQAGLAMLLCQYIPGTDADVEEAIVMRLPGGEYPIAFGCHKLRQDPPGFGSTAVGESATLPETMALARRVLDEADFVGVAGVETKRHEETGERWFLEVNVRLPAQWGLGDACGAQASPRLIAALAGRPLGPPPTMRAGVRFVRPEIDWHGWFPRLRGVPARRRPEVAWASVRPYLGARELGVLDLRDPGPMIGLVGEFTGRRVARVRARRYG